MNKLVLQPLVLVAGLMLAGASFAQPDHRGEGPGIGRPHHVQPHHKHKVWVPAHREHGHMVRGHYVWR